MLLGKAARGYYGRALRWRLVWNFVLFLLTGWGYTGQQKHHSPTQLLRNSALLSSTLWNTCPVSPLITAKIKRRIFWFFQTHRMFLHSLYQRMITGQVYVSSPDSSALSRYSWSDMCNLVSEQLSAQLSELNRANERVSHSYLLTLQF